MRVMIGTAAMILTAGCGSGSETAAGPENAPNCGDGKLFWTSDGSVHTAGLDGKGAKSLGMPADATGITVDWFAKKVYWGDRSLGTINRANYDGSAAAVIFSGGAGSTDLDHMALDHHAGKLFWTSDGFIWTSDLDGKGAQSGAQDLHATGIAVDPRTQKLYWGGGDDIKRSNYDRSNVEVIHAGSDEAYSVALDPYADRLFWRDKGTVMSATLDGNQVKVVSSVDASCIGVDPCARKLYWGDRIQDTLSRVDYDGSGAEVIYTVITKHPEGVAPAP